MREKVNFNKKRREKREKMQKLIITFMAMLFILSLFAGLLAVG